MISILLRTVIIYIMLSLVLRLMGKRQVGELQISELVSTLLLSEIAALPIDDPDIPLLYAVIPILFIFSCEVILTYLKNKIKWLQRIFESKPVVLIRRGKLDQRALTDSRISVNELLSEFRLQGVCDPADVYYAILEENGQMSLILRSSIQPLTPESADIKVDECGISHLIISDGTVNADAVRSCGYDNNWVSRICNEKKVKPENVFMLTVDDLGKTTLIKKD